MPFRPEQLPFLSYVQKVREMKRQFDRDRGVYPLTVHVSDASGELLIEETLDYVHVRVGRATRVVAIYEWAPPVTITLQGNDGTEWSATLDRVQVNDQLPIFTDEDVVGTFLEQKRKVTIAVDSHVA